MTTEIISSVLRDEIFHLLKRRGPLCASQIAVELGSSLRRVAASLQGLQSEGLVEPRPDRDRSLSVDEYETPWGLIRPSWLKFRL